MFSFNLLSQAMSQQTIQQYQVMIVDKPSKPRGKRVVTLYAVAATSREDAIAAFDKEIGSHHREMALSWACT